MKLERERKREEKLEQRRRERIVRQQQRSRRRKDDDESARQTPAKRTASRPERRRKSGGGADPSFDFDISSVTLPTPQRRRNVGGGGGGAGGGPRSNNQLIDSNVEPHSKTAVLQDKQNRRKSRPKKNRDELANDNTHAQQQQQQQQQRRQRRRTHTSSTSSLARWRRALIFDEHDVHHMEHHKNRCSHHRIDHCAWPQCNPTCPKIYHPVTMAEMDFMDLFMQFGLDTSAIADALDLEDDDVRNNQDLLFNLLINNQQ